MATIQNVGALDSLGLSQRTREMKKKDQLGQEDFLKLMMTQLQHQDPLKPMENGEFVTQMAQFSSASGIQALQKSFATLADSLSSNQALAAGGLVGRQVVVPSSIGGLGGTGPLNGLVDLPFSTNSVQLGVYDTAGQLVRQIDLGAQSAGPVRFSWDGLSDQGERVAGGRYQLKATARIDGKDQQVDTWVAGSVASVNLNNADKSLTLNIPNMGSFDFSKVKQIL